jgi:Cu/Ag efflux protein CusF
MKLQLVLVVVLLAALMSACGSKPAASNTVKITPGVAPTLSIPKDGDYPGKGVITKVNLTGEGSVEMNHEEIEGVMPAMQMEFFVSDKKMLDRVQVGDKVDFVLRYKHPTEMIVDIRKAK